MVIEEELGFSKKIAKFDKGIDKLEYKNNKHVPKNDKQKKYKKELKDYIKILRDNSKELKKLNNYDFENKEQEQLAKKVIKKLIQNQMSFISGINNAGFIGFLKELGLGTVVGALLGGFAYLLNNQSFNNHGTLILGPGARVYAASKNLYNDLDIKKIMTFDAAEKGLWTGLMGTAIAARTDYDNVNNLKNFKFNLPDKKKKELKEECKYFNY